ncbi:unnamed protein product [Spirodela intermedia]|uniref:Uncharacterized protein n=1 Tax=Spirodela intermedia TaxID=51605 RepID=A0A7I8KB10_SPIIN|nr:unnamed protein product [Spirodela intermedia]
MGTFTGHFVPGMAFSLLGLWHTIKTIASKKFAGNAGFQSRTWHPLGGQLSVLRHLELLLLFCFSIFAMATQLLDHGLLHLSRRPDSFEHATMFFHLAVYACAALAADRAREHAEALGGFVGVLAANVFAQEFFLLRCHSTDHVGVEGHYHWLLQLLVFVCLLSSLTAALSPGCFPAALVRAMAVTLQGVWFIVMAFALWMPRLIAEGCHPTDTAGDVGTHGAVTCETAEADAWARVLGNLQFSWAIAGVSILTAVLCLRHGRDPTEYRRLVPGTADVLHLNPAREEDSKQVGV